METRSAPSTSLIRTQYSLGCHARMHQHHQQEEDPGDLKREAAYNLSIIYRNSGNSQLARDILMRYCTV